MLGSWYHEYRFGKKLPSYFIERIIILIFFIKSVNGPQGLALGKNVKYRRKFFFFSHRATEIKYDLNKIGNLLKWNS